MITIISSLCSSVLLGILIQSFCHIECYFIAEFGYPIRSSFPQFPVKSDFGAYYFEQTEDFDHGDNNRADSSEQPEQEHRKQHQQVKRKIKHSDLYRIIEAPQKRHPANDDENEDFMPPDWTYNDQNDWLNRYPSCGGAHQSPINIETDQVVRDPVTELFLDPNYSRCCPDMIIGNSGRAVDITIADKKELQVFATGPAVGGNLFFFSEMHFHWSEEDNGGTDHAINGERYAMEVHLVHYNNKYASVEQARNQSDGLLVLAVLFRVSEVNNPALDDIVAALPRIRCAGQETDLESRIDFMQIIPSSFNRFYQYQGSLTTPPCYESVNWIIFRNCREIGRSQIAKFRNLFEDATCTTRYGSNVRDLQTLNDRTVFKSSELRGWRSMRKGNGNGLLGSFLRG